MRLLVQRVQSASVSLAAEGAEGHKSHRVHSSIGKGLLVFIGINKTDTEADIPWLAKKLVDLRIFNDAQGKLNLSALDIKAELLIVSQFTLYAECRRGNRPDFIQAAEPSLAKTLYESFLQTINEYGLIVQTGVFAADMHVSMVNDGPVTIILESK